MQSNWKEADFSEIRLASMKFNINMNCTTKVNVTYTIILLSSSNPSGKSVWWQTSQNLRRTAAGGWGGGEVQRTDTIVPFVY